MESLREMVRGILSPGSMFREGSLRGYQWDHCKEDYIGVEDYRVSKQPERKVAQFLPSMTI